MKKIICFDVNGTLVDDEAWDFFEDQKEEVEKNYSLFSSKGITIDELFKRFVLSLIKIGKKKKSDFSNIPLGNLKEGAEEIIKYLKSKNYIIYLVSCSLDVYLEVLSKKLSLDGYYAGSKVIFDNDDNISHILGDCYKMKAFKEEKVKEIALKEGVKIEEIYFVGDGRNDLDAFKITKHGIAIDSKVEELNNCAFRKIKSLLEIKEFL